MYLCVFVYTCVIHTVYFSQLYIFVYNICRVKTQLGASERSCRVRLEQRIPKLIQLIPPQSVPGVGVSSRGRKRQNRKKDLCVLYLCICIFVYLCISHFQSDFFIWELFGRARLLPPCLFLARQIRLIGGATFYKAPKTPNKPFIVYLQHPISERQL